jgi:hypothetical protein
VSAGSIPDLSPEEVADLLRRLSLLTDEGGTVVVGGQAVHFWAWFFTARDLILDLVPPTSGDLDLCGTRSAVVRAAELLEGEPRLPGIDRHTPSAGIVNFRDSHGNDRILDIVTDPYGMRRREVVRHALRVEYRPGAADPVHFRVMNPVHCMQSRVHNVVGLHKDDAHGLRQLGASIPCAREFLRTLLDQEDVDLALRRRRVMNWNQRIYRFTRSDHDAQALYRAFDIDPFDAILVDDGRLGDRFRQDGYPRWKADLDARRRRAQRERERRAQQAKHRGS